jgi:hypothetical protein
VEPERRLLIPSVLSVWGAEQNGAGGITAGEEHRMV